LSVFAQAANGRFELAAAEVRKLPAFIRRDFLVAWSYRMSFVSDFVGLAGQALVFYFVGLMVDSSKLPRFGGSEVTYLEFAAVGMALGVFLHFALERVSAAVRGEQLMGTLESLLMTPTSTATVQLGSVTFDLIYLPLRTGVFLLALALGFGLNFELAGALPALVVLATFIPFAWGLGLASAAAVVTFKRGAGLVGMGAIGLGLLSGLYFPLELLPGWIAGIAQFNPVALAVGGMRETLLGGSGWTEIAPDLLLLAPMSAVSLVVGAFAFRLAVRRERRLGTLGLY
jgi:ABC-2 type transport system permease protein